MSGVSTERTSTGTLTTGIEQSLLQQRSRSGLAVGFQSLALVVASCATVRGSLEMAIASERLPWSQPVTLTASAIVDQALAATPL